MPVFLPQKDRVTDKFPFGAVVRNVAILDFVVLELLIVEWVLEPSIQNAHLACLRIAYNRCSDANGFIFGCLFHI